MVNNLLVMWTAFLPMGDRFSVDSMLASMKRRRETSAEELNDRSDMVLPGKETPHVTLLGLVLVIQLAAIYYFNVIHKTGPAWKNGTAVHYVLYVDRMATPMIALVRDHIPNAAILFMTKTTMVFEATIPIVLLEPLARVWARRARRGDDQRPAPRLRHDLRARPLRLVGSASSPRCSSAARTGSSRPARCGGRTARASWSSIPARAAPSLVCRLLKRLDRFELLTFEAREGVPLGIGVLHADGPGGALEPRARRR